MWDRLLKKRFKLRTAALIEDFESSKDSYRKIWNSYKQRMPNCTKEYSAARSDYGEDAEREGPQGIYWIGKKPTIFFVGQEHRGWYDESVWPDDIDDICFAPLEFSFYTVESMGDYWAIIKEIIRDVYSDEPFNWNKMLDRVAFSNACKCFSWNRSFKWRLHDNCVKQGYLLSEIDAVNAKVNVLFTKTYRVLDQIHGIKMERLFSGKEFLVRKYKSQVFIECDHPSRKSMQWRNIAPKSTCLDRSA